MQLSNHTYTVTVPDTRWLYAVPWKKSKNKFGISFHRTYQDAKKYKDITSNGEMAAGSPKLIRVSDWLAVWVSKYGDFWAPLSFMSEAINYEPTLH